MCRAVDARPHKVSTHHERPPPARSSTMIVVHASRSPAATLCRATSSCYASLPLFQIRLDRHVAFTCLISKCQSTNTRPCRRCIVMSSHSRLAFSPPPPHSRDDVWQSVDKEIDKKRVKRARRSEWTSLQPWLTTVELKSLAARWWKRLINFLSLQSRLSVLLATEPRREIKLSPGLSNNPIKFFHICVAFMPNYCSFMKS